MTDREAPENWQARLAAAVSHLDKAIDTGEREPARRALEIVNQLLAEAVILDAKKPPHAKDDQT
jgi:hypothetical protein